LKEKRFYGPSGPTRTSDRDDWETPEDIYDPLNEEFGFTLDAAASAANTKVHNNYYTKEEDAVLQPWSGVVWLNPPYGEQIGRFIRKAYRESLAGVTVVALLPARTDTIYWHECIEGKAEVRFVRGRVKFGLNGEPGVQGAPFPSVIVIWRGINQ